MNRKTLACLFVVLLAAVGGLGGCGPKDIGAGSSSENDSQPQGVSVEDQLRYPVYGSSNTQRMLYYQNRPDVMVNMQKLRMQQFRRMNGLDTDVSPEDPQYRSVPKQRSPFRQ
ncbi:MAG: chemotaxis protein [Desulfovibrio sp.]